MPDLCALQRDFARFLLLGEPETIAPHIVATDIPAPNRLAIYRNTARTVVVGALRLTFPAVDRLVGTDFFDMAATRFAQSHPPTSACLDDYGDRFPDFLAALPEAGQLPYLPDVARFEWALALAAHGTEDGADRSASLLRLDYPADRIADAVLAGDDEAMGVIDLTGGPVFLIVLRDNDSVRSVEITAQAYASLLSESTPFA